MKIIAIYNPNGHKEETLPYIIGFNNGGDSRNLLAMSMSQDGQITGSHICSNESFMVGDLGLDLRSESRVDSYKEVYPDGFRTIFVGAKGEGTDEHAELMKAIEKHQLLEAEDSKHEAASMASVSITTTGDHS